MRGAALLERFVVRRCDRIVFVAAANRNDFSAHYGPFLASKFEVVPNGCDPAEFDALGEIPAAERDLFVLLHAGSLYGGRRTPLPLLRAVARAIERGIVDRDRFRVRFLGASESERARIPAECRDLGLDTVVEFLPRVPREQSLRAMMSASALLLLQPGHAVSVPGKVYEYLAAGRPILAIAEQGEISELIQRAGVGVSVASDNEEAIVHGLADVLGRSEAPVRTPREYYDGAVGAAQIVDILEAVALGAGPRQNSRISTSDSESQFVLGEYD
jgi:glycosyltransferase involved in cell wall biosynthesis